MNDRLKNLRRLRCRLQDQIIAAEESEGRWTAEERAERLADLAESLAELDEAIIRTIEGSKL